MSALQTEYKVDVNEKNRTIKISEHKPLQIRPTVIEVPIPILKAALGNVMVREAEFEIERAAAGARILQPEKTNAPEKD